MDIKLNQLFSNKQLLLFKIIKVNNKHFYDIQFEIDGLILINQFHNQIKLGECFHPDKIKYKIKSTTKIFFHDCYLKALLCKTRREFQINFRSEYSLLFRNKWLEYACSHMVSKVNFYTKEECLEKALLCKTKIEFIKKYKNYYHQAHRHGWVNEITNHTIKNYKYTKEECLEIALKYKRRIDFQLKDNKIYNFVRNHNLLNELCNHMNPLPKRWTVDDCYRLALKCDSRKEFSIKYPNAYCAARKSLNCLDEICDHMKSINQLEFPRLIYAYEFEDKSIYIGLTKNFNQRKLHRNRNIKDSVTAYIIQTGLKPKIKFLTNLIPAELAQLKEQEFIDKYRNEGYNILNKVRGGSLGGSITKRIV